MRPMSVCECHTVYGFEVETVFSRQSHFYAESGCRLYAKLFRARELNQFKIIAYSDLT